MWLQRGGLTRLAAFYLTDDGQRFESTSATAGPWSPGLQHGGPPAALLARAMEAEPSPVPQRLVRLTVEILRPVPVSPLEIRVEVVRPGRRVALLEARGEAGGVECLRARGWKVEIPAAPGPRIRYPFSVPPLPARAELAAWPGAYLDGYMAAIEWRPAAGSIALPGPADVWARSRLELVEGEVMSPFCRAAILADSGSGVGLSFDLGEVFSINVDLTLTMWREVAGEWLFMSARTVSDEFGAGIAETLLGDEGGIAGRGLQTLLVSGR